MDNKANESGDDTSRVQPCFEAFDNIMGAIRQPIVVLDCDLKVVKANRSFYQMFNIKPDETEGILIYDLGNRQWNIPKLRELLEGILSEDTSFNDFEVEHTFSTIGRMIMHVSAKQICTKPSQTQLILLAIEDVTKREDQKRDLEELINKRTIELVVAREEADKRKEIAEAALAEIKKLKEQLEGERAYL